MQRRGPTGRTAGGSWLPSYRLHELLAKADLDPSVVGELRNHRDEEVALAAACHVQSDPMPMDLGMLEGLQSRALAKDSLDWQFDTKLFRLVESALCVGIIRYRRMPSIPNHICVAAVVNPWCPPALRALMMQSPIDDVREAARRIREPSHRPLETRASKGPEHLPPSKLKKFARGKEIYSRLRAVRNPKCPPELLREVWANHPPELPTTGPLSRERHLLMGYLLARVDLPVDLLLEIAAEHFRPYRVATHNPQYPWRQRERPPELFEATDFASFGELRISTDFDPVPCNRHDISLMIAEHPSCPAEWRERIMRFLVAEGLQNCHVNLVRDPDGDPLAAEAIRIRLIREMLDHEFGAPVRLLALDSHFCPPEMLAKAARSHSWLERVAVAQHPRTPQPVRQKLTNDGSQWVRWAAEEVGNVDAPPDDLI